MTGALPSNGIERAAFAAIAEALKGAGEEKGPFIVGVSGGSDSMALLHVAARAMPGRVMAATVDHGLRAASRGEADMVEAFCRAAGLPHFRLTWEGEKPQAGLQAAAREARYGLLGGLARRLGSGAKALPLLTAHTADDQRETFLLRLAHRSGIEGLAAIPPQSELLGAPPVPLLRPLLAVTRQDLRALLHVAGVPFIDDPSNEDRHFERVRLRQLMPRLAATGLDAERLGRLVDLFARMRRHHETLARRFAAETVAYDGLGAAQIDLVRFRALPAPFARLVLRDVLRAVSGSVYGPGLAPLEDLAGRLARNGSRGASLGGSLLRPAGAGALRVFREVRRSGPPPMTIGPMSRAIWDGRFLIDNGSSRPVEVLTAAAIERRIPRPVRKAIDVPYLKWRATPALLAEGEVVALPALGWAAEAYGPARAIFVGRERVEGRLRALFAAEFGPLAA